MLREGIHKRAVVSNAVFSPRPTYSLYGRDRFGASVAEQRSPGKQRALVQTHEPKPCKVGTSARGSCCPLSLSLAFSSSEAAVISVVPGWLLSFTHKFWHRLFWQFQNLLLLKPCAGIANLHANRDMFFLALLIQDF